MKRGGGPLAEVRSDEERRGCAPRTLGRRGALQVLVAASAALPACLHQAHFSAAPAQGGQIFVPQAELAQLTGPADVLFVRSDGAPGTIALRRPAAGQYRAVLALCTHRGCELSALPQSYDCACHGSRFDLAGEVIEGPAERPLATLPVRAAEGGVVVSLLGGLGGGAT